MKILNRLDDERRKTRKFKKLKFRRTRFRRGILDAPEIQVKQKTRYELKMKNEMVSPFSMIAKSLTSMVREQKNKDKEKTKT